MSAHLVSRRRVLRHGAALTAASVLGMPAIAQTRTKVRLGYLHVVAVDGHIWTGLDRGSFEREGIDFELHAFNTGPEVFEAMMRGELDVASAGGVISNYLALGRGRLSPGPESASGRSAGRTPAGDGSGGSGGP